RDCSSVAKRLRADDDGLRAPKSNFKMLTSTRSILNFSMVAELIANLQMRTEESSRYLREDADPLSYTRAESIRRTCESFDELRQPANLAPWVTLMSSTRALPLWSRVHRMAVARVCGASRVSFR